MSHSDWTTVPGLERVGGVARDGRRMNGVIRTQHEVHCAGCETAYLGLGGTVREAQVELRKSGWHTRQGLWVCEECWNRRIT